MPPKLSIFKKLILTIISVTFAVAALFIAQRFSVTLTESFTQDELVPQELKEALYWQDAGQGKVQCFLCPRQCVISVNQRGFCRSRKNIKGKLYCLTYGQPVAIHVDPIEKKPFFHVYPGSKSFSIATAGCNLRCKFCQNWEISQLDPESVKVGFVSPQEIIRQAKATGSKTVAFTYTEPTIFYEYMLDIAKLAKQEGIACVMHSAGLINEKPLRQLSKYLTAADIDLKGFSEKYYASFCDGSLSGVLNSLKVLKAEGVWIEITNLIIPTANDSDEDISNLCIWVRDNLGPDTPLHFSRFFPMYKLLDLSPTPLKTLTRAGEIAKKTGLHYVYLGNIVQNIGEDTICPVCGKLLIKRIGYNILENNISAGKCKFCADDIAGVWD
ncbi:MAG: AmmeMemoRadiSam system radical SAM enzyme [Candidatus Omnitrophica bacterium CG11_big_fil_rev_8_21_14_0_20_43_6]|nr:MAG: AmmeMemoRadiSam system radical SAM enzyme [Candidatus Omnitrophica bacterium CG11_big_fil_rev_8_21_14_0_20_43_6]